MQDTEISARWSAAITEAKEILFNTGVKHFTGDTIVALAKELIATEDAKAVVRQSTGPR